MPISMTGTEFTVNSITQGTQQRSAVSVFSDGRFIATWESYETPSGDGDGSCIRARIFDANGNPAGAEFVVDTTATGPQLEPAVTTFADGRFLVTWYSWDTGDGSEYCIRARLYDADGNAEGSDFIVNSTTSLSQYSPETTVLSDGRFVVTWVSADTGDGSLWCSRARIFAADGTPEGNDFIVNTTTAAYQYEAEVTALADGAFVVVFRSWENGFGTDMGIRARLFDGDGNPTGNDFLVESTHTASQYTPSVAALADGRFVVTWHSDELDPNDLYVIRGRIFGADGTPAANDFVVNSTPAGVHSGSAVAGLADGRFAVAWIDNQAASGDGSGRSIRARIFNEDGTPDGNDFIANTSTAGDQEFPAITALPDGSFIVTWDGVDGIGSNRGIRAQIFDPTVFIGTAGVDVWKGGDFADTITGAGDNDLLSGLDGNDTIGGDEGNDTIDGGAGADAMTGGLGDDTFAVDDAGDTVIEADETGTDTINSAVTFSLAGQFIENLTLTGSGDIDGAGNGLANVLVGNAGINSIDGGGGADTLDGGGGKDTLTGGADDDTYFVDSLDDVVVEGAGDGVADQVKASTTYVLGAGVYVEQLATILSSATTAINLTGNALSQEITGNDGANTLKDGGGAADVLNGLAGNDTYLIYASGTTVSEGLTQGAADRVLAAVDFVLGAGVYVEQLTTTSAAGTSGVDLTGNALAQEIIGNAGANILSDGGKGAADTLRGLGGNDTYRIYNAGDLIQESAAQGASDRVTSAVDYQLAAGVYVEMMTTNGSTGTSGVDLTGNESVQSIIGNAGANILDGKDGNDTLQGLGGKDFFVFSSTLGAGNVDTISDFNVVDDTIRLENAVFTALMATGVLANGKFRANAAGVALDANDFIVYETDTGKLFFDADGNGAGAAIQFAVLTGNPTLTATDFVVI